MLYSETNDRLVFAVEKDSLTCLSNDLVESVCSAVRAHQQENQFDFRELKVDELMKEVVEQQATIRVPNGFSMEDADNPVKTANLVHDEMYYFHMVTFEVEETTFLLPKHMFVQTTNSFAVIFEAGHGTPENPIQLPDVLASDFRGLMRYLYPLNGKMLAHSFWISTLKLSTKWKMLDTRAEAIQKLENNLSTVAKVQLGNECMVADWARTGYTALAERQEHFSEAEIHTIGLGRAVKLSEIREQGFAGEWDTYLNRLTLDAHGMSNLIPQLFGEKGWTEDDVDLVGAILEAQSLPNPMLLLHLCDKMAKRLRSLTIEEAERLGLATTLKLWKARMEARRAARSLVRDTSDTRERADTSPAERVSTVFGAELTEIELAESVYLLPKQAKGKEASPPYKQNQKVEYREEDECKLEDLDSPWTSRESAGDVDGSGFGSTLSRAASKASTWGTARNPRGLETVPGSGWGAREDTRSTRTRKKA